MLQEDTWSEPRLDVSNMQYKEAKDLIASKAKEYQIYINPKILGTSTLHQYAYETCPSFPE